VCFQVEYHHGVPNFIGATLPCFDQGDREYYCCTMLMLFKPWRSGLDLKNREESWDDAFSDASFSPRQREIMKYMNIRYKCLDAQDDFHEQMTNGATQIPTNGGPDDRFYRSPEDMMMEESVGALNKTFTINDNFISTTSHS
jgi:hypothetical protein